MTHIYMTLAVEDSLSEAVARKILCQSERNYYYASRRVLA